MFKKFLCAALLALVTVGASAQATNPGPFIPQLHGTTSIDVTASAQSLTIAVPVLPGPLMTVVLQTWDSSGGTCSTPVRVAIGGTASVTTDFPVFPKNGVRIGVPASTTSLSVISSATGCTLYASVGAGQ